LFPIVKQPGMKLPTKLNLALGVRMTGAVPLFSPMLHDVDRDNFTFFTFNKPHRRSGSSVGIVTAYGLDGPRMEFRWGARFSAPVQTVPEAHPASCTMGTRSFRGKVRQGRDLDPSPLLVPRSEIE
jgi:hypothetical protein